jgi:hypothetical protein
MGPPCNDQLGVSLPEVFCWTKFGDEAGEETRAIFHRKEIERQKNRGNFLWGIGQSIRPSLLELLRIDSAPEVLFSPMKSAPARHDMSPSSIVVWHEGVGLDGRPYSLPEYSVVTSRRDDRLPRDHHFALVCECHSPISLQGRGAPNLRSTDLRNLVSGSTVGSSQVTSVVRRTQDVETSSTEYPVIVMARLVAPYLVRLTSGVVIPSHFQIGSLSPAHPKPAIDKFLQFRRVGADTGGRIGASTNVLW